MLSRGARIRRVLRRLGRLVLVLIVLYALAAGLLPLWRVGGPLPPAQAPATNVYITTNGLHTDVWLPSQVPLGADSAVQPLDSLLGLPPGPPGYRVLGWGHRAFYLAGPQPDEVRFYFFGLRLLVPSRSSLRVNCLAGPPAVGPTARRLVVGPNQLADLVAFMQRTLGTANGAEAQPIAQPSPLPGQFYESPLRYHAFYTCNHWTTQCLATLGASRPLWSPMAWGVMWQLR